MDKKNTPKNDSFGVGWFLDPFDKLRINTEPVVRVNLEARSQQLLDEKQAELISLIN